MIRAHLLPALLCSAALLSAAALAACTSAHASRPARVAVYQPAAPDPWDVPTRPAMPAEAEAEDDNVHIHIGLHVYDHNHGGSIDQDCPAGRCHFECPPGETCNFECDGGHCDMACAPGATCNLECDGGHCDAACADGATAVHGCETNFPAESDFTRPDPRLDKENCFWYTGWNQGGLVILELTNPEYNACMRRAIRGQGRFMDPGKGKKSVTFTLNGRRGNKGRGGLEGSAQVIDNANNVIIQVNSLTMLGGVRDACGPVTGRASAVQLEGDGTFNGRAASFRICAQESSAEGFRGHAERFALSCTAGCAYETGGDLISGNISVTQRD